MPVDGVAVEVPASVVVEVGADAAAAPAAGERSRVVRRVGDRDVERIGVAALCVAAPRPVEVGAVGLAGNRCHRRRPASRTSTAPADSVMKKSTLPYALECTDSRTGSPSGSPSAVRNATSTATRCVKCTSIGTRSGRNPGGSSISPMSVTVIPGGASTSSRTRIGTGRSLRSAKGSGLRSVARV